MSDTLAGVIERVTFHNAESGFTVLRVQLDRRRDLVTVVGHLPSAVAGEYVEAAGEWVNDRDHGMQFKAANLRTAAPQTLEGIEKYLASGMVKGIGKHYARKIVETFGLRTLAIIDESPSFLREIEGIGPQRVQRIRDSWKQQQGVRNIMVFLQSHGLGTARAVRIYRTYGDGAVEMVRADPYRLATDIWGIGFQSADELAARLGIDRASPLRARAAVRFVLQSLRGEGHCGFPVDGVVERTVALTEIDEQVVRSAADELCAAGELVRENPNPSQRHREAPTEPWLYLKPLFQAEVGVAQTVLALKEGDHPLHAIDADKALGWVAKRIGLELAPSQREAIRQAVTRKLLVITGGPGVGKSTIVRAILEIFQAKALRCALCAPTGRAAKRLAETSGMATSTIHRLLEYEPAAGGFLRNRDNPLDCDLLVVDESSMVDVVLMHQLLRAVPPRACVVLVGDVDQLPPVGPGAVLGDLIASGAVPVTRLTEIFRQAGHSGIVRAAHAVQRGEIPESATADHLGDFYLVEAPTPDVVIERLTTLVRERIPSRFGLDALRDVQVLTPMNRSELGTRNLNARLQDVLNPATGVAEVQRFGWTFRAGDKVMQTVNNYQKEVFNGDIGRVLTVDLDEQEMTVLLDGREVVYDFGELDELMLAYAVTIHKSQGSEYPAVIIPLHTQHFVMLRRNLLYTAITRGRKLVVVVGNRKALSMAVERQDDAQRMTGLRWRIMAT